MSTFKRFEATDLFSLNSINLDSFTENYDPKFYLHYIINHPEYNTLSLSSLDSRPQGYVLGKKEGKGSNFHGHVTALTVSPFYRRAGVANRLMNELEMVGIGKVFFVDLYVRTSNKAAIEMYSKNSYYIYREIEDYYSDPRENAYDMRKNFLSTNGGPTNKIIHASDI